MDISNIFAYNGRRENILNICRRSRAARSDCRGFGSAGFVEGRTGCRPSFAPCVVAQVHSNTHRRSILSVHVALPTHKARNRPLRRIFSNLTYIPTWSRAPSIFSHGQCIENAEKGCELSALHMPERREDPRRSCGNSGFRGVNSPPSGSVVAHRRAGIPSLVVSGSVPRGAAPCRARARRPTWPSLPDRRACRVTRGPSGAGGIRAFSTHVLGE